ncbi:hypothetical protein AGMMS50233_06680 [Endomicrobiia bacterium]|nr:hypothetical protein AGMMS50233_06680 [Endomicrobiia bacterium]
MMIAGQLRLTLKSHILAMTKYFLRYSSVMTKGLLSKTFLEPDNCRKYVSLDFTKA